jgi:hypothetical protein
MLSTAHHIKAVMSFTVGHTSVLCWHVRSLLVSNDHDCARTLTPEQGCVADSFYYYSLTAIVLCKTSLLTAALS